MHTTCRACSFGSVVFPEGVKSDKPPQLLIPVFSLGLQPLANDFRKPEEERAGFAPLEVLLCPQCHLAQLSVVVRPDILYSHYCYRTSPSETMLAHFNKLAKVIKAEGPHERILEIGSNDGRFLAHLKECLPCEVLGVDPAQNLVDEANLNGIETVWGTLHNCLGQKRGMFDVVIARHVFCHIDDWRGFIKDLEKATHKNSLVCIEVPWVQKTLDNLEFDTIYHEHLSYFSVYAMQTLISESAFYIWRVIDCDIHGGALLVLLRRRESGIKIDASVEKHLDAEHCGEHAWRRFSNRSWLSIGQLRARIGGLRAEGKTLAAYGASAKSTVLINACKFTKKDIAWIADCTPEKQWRLSPGSDIPIVDEGALLRELPDYCLMTCWNFESEVIEKNALYLKKGGHFIIPVPEFKIV